MVLMAQLRQPPVTIPLRYAERPSGGAAGAEGNPHLGYYRPSTASGPSRVVASRLSGVDHTLQDRTNDHARLSPTFDIAGGPAVAKGPPGARPLPPRPPRPSDSAVSLDSVAHQSALQHAVARKAHAIFFTEVLPQLQAEVPSLGEAEYRHLAKERWRGLEKERRRLYKRMAAAALGSPPDAAAKDAPPAGPAPRADVRITRSLSLPVYQSQSADTRSRAPVRSGSAEGRSVPPTQPMSRLSARAPASARVVERPLPRSASAERPPLSPSGAALSPRRVATTVRVRPVSAPEATSGGVRLRALSLDRAMELRGSRPDAALPGSSRSAGPDTPPRGRCLSMDTPHDPRPPLRYARPPPPAPAPAAAPTAAAAAPPPSPTNPTASTATAPPTAPLPPRSPPKVSPTESDREPSLLSVNSFITALFRLGIAELRELCEQLDVRIQYRYQPLTKDQIIHQVVAKLNAQEPRLPADWSGKLLVLLRRSGKDTTVPQTHDVVGHLFLSLIKPPPSPSVEYLQQRLHERGLATHGQKPELMARLHQQMLREAKCRIPPHMPTHLEAKALVPASSVWVGYCRASGADAPSPAKLDISNQAAAASNWRWQSGDWTRMVVAILYGELTCDGVQQAVWVILYLTIDGCILVKIDEMQFHGKQRLLEGEVQGEGPATVIRGRVAFRTGTGDLNFYLDNAFQLQLDRSQPSTCRLQGPATRVARPPPPPPQPSASVPRPPPPGAAASASASATASSARGAAAPPAFDGRPQPQPQPQPARAPGSTTWYSARPSARPAGPAAGVGLSPYRCPPNAPKAQSSEEAWRAFQAKVDSGQLSLITFSDVPFPLLPLSLPPVAHQNPQRRRELVRALQMRWHPDKFLQLFGAKLAPADQERILTRVKEVSQAINGL